MDLAYLRERTDKNLTNYRHAHLRFKEEKVALVAANKRLEHCEHAQRIVQAVAQGVQQAAHDQIAKVVSRCLEAVFPEPYEFRINFDRKRGRTEASLVFVKDGTEYDPVSSAGGGVVDVAAFALRLACLLVQRPKVRRFMALDEPFKHLSEAYRPRVRELLLTLAEEMGVQFVVVTHSEELVCGKIIRTGG